MKANRLLKNGVVLTLCAASLVTGMAGCNAWKGMSQTGQGATAGGVLGAAVGSGVGALIGGGKGTWIGALVGSALGAGTGALVGNSMQKQKDALEAQLNELKQQQDKNTEDIATNAQNIEKNRQDIDDIRVQMVKDRNNLDAIKLVMGDAVLFKTNSYNLSAEADAMLTRIAYNLKQYPNTDVTVVGFTDNTGTAAYNDKLSLQRAESVVTFLENHGIAESRLKAVGNGENDPIAPNTTVEGRAQNRRVEMYITADKKMIDQAEKNSNDTAYLFK